MINKILITGSSGIIGTRLTEKLISEGYEIVGIDKRENKWNKEINENTLIGDLRDKKNFEKIPEGIDLIIHLAANARVYDLIENPEKSFENIKILFNVLEFSRLRNIRRMIFSSSREVYGENSSMNKLQSEENQIRGGENLYSASKISGEFLIKAYNKSHGLNFLILRFGNVYGMYDEYDRVIPAFIRKCKKNEDLTIIGRDKRIDFIYIDDLVEGIILSIKKFDKIKNETINVGSGLATPIMKIAEFIKKEMRKENSIIIKDNRTGEVLNSVLDISKAKRILNFYPKTNIEEGLKKTIKWYNKNMDDN